MLPLPFPVPKDMRSLYNIPQSTSIKKMKIPLHYKVEENVWILQFAQECCR